ncbi:MAG: hypothetical protein IJ593_06830, partial [Lachnospiraceae bacterium]|nr:hypothetical protein [Lachnospiraceae bacterium]
MQYKPVETPLTDLNFTSKAVPGYIPDAANSAINPSRFIYRADELDVGSFTTDASGTVSLAPAVPFVLADESQDVNQSGYLPAARTTVNFKYNVDTTFTSPLKVQFFRRNSAGDTPFNVNGNTEVTAGNYNPEENVTYDAPEKAGYTIIGAEFVSGNVADSTHFLTAATGEFESANNYRFRGKMPNQEVIIKYIYELSAGTNEFIVEHDDIDVNDSSFKVINSVVDAKGSEENLEAHKRTDLYGYTFSGAEVDPSTIGSFDGDYNYTGTMPLSESVMVTYKYNRYTNYFKTLTFKKSSLQGCDNNLTTSGSPDMDIITDGSEASVQALTTTNDGAGWKFSELVRRNLVPNIVITDTENYYVEGETGFFIDANDNGVFDNGETVVTNDYEFTGDVTLTAYAKKIVYYVNISFRTDGNGILSGNPETTYERGVTFGEIEKPTATGYYYRLLGWFVDDIEVADDYVVHDNDIFVAKFEKDTTLQDAVKKVLYTTSIDDVGHGVITIRDLHENYTYVLTNSDDEILNVVDITDSSTTHDFTYDDEIDINSIYKIYEVKGLTAEQINPLVDINEVRDLVDDDPDNRSISHETICYVPAVIKNYEVSVDNEALTTGNVDVAKLTIKPTSSDYEYAIFKNGNIVDGTDFIEGNVSGITFNGLKPGNTYIVVTRANGVDTTFMGTVVYIDTIEELTEDSFVVQVINGTVNGETAAIIKAGEKVNIATTDVNFVRWQALNTNLAFASANSPETTFT